MPLVKKIPPPPPIANQNPTFNRWLLELTAILNNQGGIDQGSVTDLPTDLTTLGADVVANAAAIAAETTRAEAAEALLAPLASPVFTGVPTAPTAAPGDDSTQIATTDFVQARGGATHNGTGAPAAGFGAVGDWYGDVAGAVGARVWIKTAVATWTAFPF